MRVGSRVLLDEVACAAAEEAVNECAGAACTECLMSADGVMRGFVEGHPSCEDLKATSFCEDVQAAAEGCDEICAEMGNCSTELIAAEQSCESDDERAEENECAHMCTKGPAGSLRSS